MVFVRRAAENRPSHDPGVLECDAVVSPEEADGEMWGGGGVEVRRWGRCSVTLGHLLLKH